MYSFTSVFKTYNKERKPAYSPQPRQPRQQKGSTWIYVGRRKRQDLLSKLEA